MINNHYYGQPQTGISGGGGGGGGGSSLAQNAILAGVGGLALYGALKPSQEKTIIIHDSPTNAAPAAPAAVAPAAAPVAPIAPAAPYAPLAPEYAPVVPVPQYQVPQYNPSNIPPIVPNDPQQQPYMPYVPPGNLSNLQIHEIRWLSQSLLTFHFFVPVNASDNTTTAPIPGQQPTYVLPVTSQPLYPVQQPDSYDPITGVRLAPLPSDPTAVPIAPTNVPYNGQPTTRIGSDPLHSSSAVPLAPFPSGGAQPHTGDGSSSSATTFAVFNVVAYAIVAMLVKML